MTARSTMASWKDSTVWYRQQRQRQGAIEHSKTSGPLSICLQENWTIAKSAYPLEVRKNLFIGGMPESVKAYAETGSMRNTFEVQAEIYETYRLDFAKYSP